MSYLNETDLVCVKLPPDVSPTSSEDSPRYLAIALNDDDSPRCLGTGLSFLPHYEVMARACMERAVLTVDGSLRVKGRRVEPDTYLRRWRAALKAAISLDQLPRRCGLHAVAEFRFVATDALLHAKPRWVNSPYLNLTSLLQAHGPNHNSRRGEASLLINLAARNGARDAWWANDWIVSSQASQAATPLVLRFKSPADIQPLPWANAPVTDPLARALNYTQALGASL